MRVLFVGLQADRDRLRPRLAADRIEIAAEFGTLAAARESRIDADGVLLAGVAPPRDLPPEPLTPREIQVLELLVEGLSNKTIAARLGISDQTVKFHVAAISGKLGAVNRTDAVRRAIRQGLIAV
jgi:DNA-binding NarL/FixJ family response regulator